MEDKIIMSTVLNNIKGACDLLMHGAIESSTPEIHNTFKTELENMISTQNQVYSKMNEKGWYQSQTVEQQKIDATKSKYSAAAGSTNSTSSTKPKGWF